MAYPVQPVEFLDVGNALRTGADAAAQMQRSQLLREEDAQRKAAAQYIQPALAGDVTALGRLIGGDPRAAQIVGNTTQQMDARKKALAAEQAKFTQDTYAGLQGVPAEQREAIYQQRKQEAAAKGWDISLWGPNYNEAWGSFYNDQARKLQDAITLKAAPSGGTAQPLPMPLPNPNGTGARPPPPPVVAPPPTPVVPPGALPPFAVPGMPSASAAPPGNPNVSQASYAPNGNSQSGQVVNYLVSRHGMTPLQAQAVAGNLQQESGFRTDAVGDNGTAFGMGQWRLDRAQNLARFAHQQGASPTDPKIQLDFLVSEMRGGDQGAQRAWAMLQQARTPQEATAAMMHYFRPQGYTPNNPQGGHGFAQRLQYTAQAGGGEAGGMTGGGMPVYGMPGGPPVGAPQGVQQASYDGPVVYPVPRTRFDEARQGTVYNDGSGRAEPGGPVLGPASAAMPDLMGGDPNLVQAQSPRITPQRPDQVTTQPPPSPTQTAPPEIDLARQVNNQLKSSGSPARVATREGRPTIKDDAIEVVYPDRTTGWVRLPPKKEEHAFGSGENGLAMSYLVKGKTNPEWLKDPANAALYDMAYRRVSRGETRIQVIDGQQVPVTIQPLDLSGYPVPPGMTAPAAAPAAPPTGQPPASAPAPAQSNVRVGPSIGASDKPLTEFQSKSAGFHTRMTNAEKSIEQFTESGLQPGGNLARGVPFAGNYLKSDEYQRYDRARRDFINAVLRLELGSAIGADEFANAEQQYFPVPGDKPGVIEDKRIARQIVTEAMKISAGPGMRQVTPNAPMSDADAEKERERLKKKYNLK